MKGAGPQASVITLANGVNDYILKFAGGTTSQNGAQISDLGFNCNGANQTAGGGIYAYGAYRCLFENLWIKRAYNEGIYFLYGPGGIQPLATRTGCGHASIENGNLSAGTGMRRPALRAASKTTLRKHNLPTGSLTFLMKVARRTLKAARFSAGKGAVKCNSKLDEDLPTCTFDSHRRAQRGACRRANIVEDNTFIGIGTGAAVTQHLYRCVHA